MVAILHRSRLALLHGRLLSQKIKRTYIARRAYKGADVEKGCKVKAIKCVRDSKDSGPLELRRVPKLACTARAVEYTGGRASVSSVRHPRQTSCLHILFLLDQETLVEKGGRRAHRRGRERSILGASRRCDRVQRGVPFFQLRATLCLIR